MQASAFEMETSAALGFGFRCGFLGLLHLEIIQERLTREYDLDLITTAPSVIYKILKNDGESLIDLHNPAGHARSESTIERDRGAVDQGDDLYVPDEYLGSASSNCARTGAGSRSNLTYVGGRAQVIYELPLNEVVFDFYDRLKSDLVAVMRASIIEQIGHRPGDLVKDDDPGQRRERRCAQP